jgi:hypothetical protein
VLPSNNDFKSTVERQQTHKPSNNDFKSTVERAADSQVCLPHYYSYLLTNAFVRHIQLPPMTCPLISFSDETLHHSVSRSGDIMTGSCITSSSPVTTHS